MEKSENNLCAVADRLESLVETVDGLMGEIESSLKDKQSDVRDLLHGFAIDLRTVKEIQAIQLGNVCHSIEELESMLVKALTCAAIEVSRDHTA